MTSENITEKLKALGLHMKLNPGSSAIANKIIETALTPCETIYKKNLVSIVIPYYNQEDTLYETIKSAVNQSYSNLEIIIVNDGSEQNKVKNIIQNFLDFNPNFIIKYFYKKNSGLADTRNYGIKRANGKYILPLDSDDMISSVFLEKTVEYLEANPKMSFVYTETLFFGSKFEIWSATDFDNNLILQKNLMTCTTLYKKSMWSNIGGYNTNMHHGYEDWDFWISAVENGHNGSNIHIPLFLYRRKHNSMLENRASYDLACKIQIINNHPKIYIPKNKIDKKHLSEKIGYIPSFFLKQNKNSTMPNNKLSKKTLHVCHNFPPFSTAGAQLYAKKLSDYLNLNTENNSEIIHPVFSNDNLDYKITQHKIDNTNINRLHKETTYGFSQSVRHEDVFNLFDNFLSTHDFDVIHIHSLGQLSASPIEVAKKHSKTIVLTLHDLWFLCFFWFMTTPDQKRCTGPDSPEKCARCFIKYFHVPNKSEFSFEEVVDFFRYRKEYFKQMFDIADYKFAPSQYLINEYKRFGYNGITLSPLGFEHITSSAKTNSKNIRFGYIGNISIRKGVNLLIDAFEYIHKIFPNTQLNIHGNSSEPVFLDYVTKRIANHPAMNYYGKYTPEDLSRIFSDIDILIVPSLWENFPLVVQESFQHKTPVIASNVAGFPEMIQNGQTGLLFNVGDTQDLAEKLLFICSKPEMIQKFRNNISPVRSIQDDVELYLNVYNKGTSNIPLKSSSPVSTEKYRILFFFFKNVHIPILLPLYHALKAQNANVDIAFSYLPPSPEIRAGLLPDEVRIIEQAGVPIYATPQEFRPDLTFIADSVYPWVEGCGKLVHVGHGVLSKGQYYTDTPTARREELADLVCVPGKHHQGIMRRIISKPVVATGMCKLDDLFSGKINRASVIKQFGLPEDYRYVLFAPTFNDELSAIPFVKDRIGDVLPDGKTLLIVKLHASTKPEYKKMYRALPGRDKRVIFADELDITPFLALCDVMISDVSSAMMEFAALDKPVILFNNPGWTSYQNYNPADIEFQWRDIGIQVSDLGEMKEAVSRCLEDPGLNADKRKKYTDLLFANKRDGNAAQRIVKLALSLVEAEQKR